MVEVARKLARAIPSSSRLMLAVAPCPDANPACLALLWRYRRQDGNMSTSFECSRNHVIANLGLLLAAAGVALLRSPPPDILVGLVIAALFLNSAIRVFRQAWPKFRRV
jgi:Co/Zn/Cd efflux system component